MDKDGGTPRKLIYKEAAKPGTYFLYNPGVDPDSKWFTGVLDISGKEPRVWIANNYKEFKKGNRYLFD